MLVAEIGNGLTIPRHDYCVMAGDAYESGFHVEALVDSGSKISIMKHSTFQRYFPNKIMSARSRSDKTYGGVNRSPLTIHGYVDLLIRVHLLPHESFRVRFAVVPDSTMLYDALLGRDFMMRPGLFVTFGLALQMMYIEPTDDLALIDLDQRRKIDLLDLPSVKGLLHLRLQQIMERFFARREHTPIQMRIRMKFRSKVKSRQTNREKLSDIQWSAVRKIVNDLLNRQIIRYSKSEFLNPIRVKNRRGRIFFDLDYTDLNRVTYADHLRSFVDFNLERLSSKSCFTVLSIKLDQENLVMAESSAKYTAFATIDGTYEFTRMPYGLKNFNCSFQNYLNIVYKNLLTDEEVLLYDNKIIVSTTDFEKNLSVLARVIDLLAINGLKLHLHECRFLQTEIEVMGYRVKDNHLTPSRKIVGPIEDLNFPESNQDIQRFLFLIDHFKHLIPDFDKLRKMFVDRGKETEKSFQILKQNLMQAPVLSFYSTKAATEVHVSTGDLEFWAVLMQRRSGQFHPVCYFNRKLLAGERRLRCATLYRVVINYTLKKFHPFLKHNPFTIITDVELRMSDLKAKAKIYSFKIEHRNFKLGWRKFNSHLNLRFE